MTKIGDYNARAAGIAWIREEDYEACIAVFEDGHMFDGDWKAWEQRAKAKENDLKNQGMIVERVYIDPDTWTDWCAANGVGTGRDGRLKFGADGVSKYGRNLS
jgi:hypothetical protein